jgi:hypothetical protein
MADYLTTKGSTIILRIRLTPKASSNNVGGIYKDEKAEDWLKASVTTVPEKGRANADLIALLSKQFKIRKTAFTLIAGETDRHKIFEISDALEAIPIIRMRAQP